MIETILYSGGGMKGLYYSGCIKALYEMNIKPKRFIGVSIGAVFAFFHSIGFTYQDFFHLVHYFDIDKIQNINFYHFFESYGLDDTNDYIEYGRAVFKYKFKKNSITFKEHYEITNNYLQLPVLCLTTGKLEVFDYKIYPDLDIFEVLKMSISAPIIFKPIYFENKLYVDAGIYDNNGYSILEENEFNNALCIDFEWNNETYDTSSFPKYMFAILMVLLTEKRKIPSSLKYLQLKNSNMNTFDFSKINENKTKLIDEGYRQTLEYINHFLKPLEETKQTSSEQSSNNIESINNNESINIINLEHSENNELENDNVD
jgi:predicted acylesterase/phospholipase RssA